MSVNRNYRVTVNLSNFFHDHRSRARIFINDDIEAISDLEDRIKRIFGIFNFHLTSQNEFLPPSEDARILQKDDIVWVVPNGEYYESAIQSIGLSNVSSTDTNQKEKSSKKRSNALVEEFVEEELRSPIKKKKKVKKYEGENEKTDGGCFEGVIPDKTKKKKKKDSANHSEKIIDHIDLEAYSTPLEEATKQENEKRDGGYFESVIPDKTKKKKIKDSASHSEVIDHIDLEAYNTSLEEATKSKSCRDSSIDIPSSTTKAVASPKSNVMKINTLLPMLQSHINTYNKKMNNASNLNQTIASPDALSSNIIKNPISDKKPYICKGNLAAYKRNLTIPTITDEYLNRKKVNIVKIEYLSSKPAIPEKTKLRENDTNIENVETSSLLEEFPDQTKDKQSLVECEVNVAQRMDIDLSETKDDITETIYCNDVQNNGEIKINSVESQVKSDVNTSYGQNSPEDEISSICFDLKSNSSSNKNALMKIETKENEDTHETQKKLFEEGISSNSTCSDLNLPVQENESLAVTSSAVKGCEIINTLGKVEKDVFVKRLDTPVPQKYFFFKEMHSDKNAVNSKDTEVKNVIKKNSDYLISTILSPDLSQDQKIKSVVSNEEMQSVKKSDHCLVTELNTISSIIMNKTLNNESTQYSNIFGDTGKSPDLLGIDTSLDNSLSQLSSKVDPLEKPTDEIDLETPKIVQGEEDCKNTIITDVGSENKSKFFILRQQSGIGYLLSGLRENESTVALDSVDSDSSEFVTKRQRNRVRKRRRKNRNQGSSTSLTDTSLTTIPSPIQPTPLKTKASPSIHIKFEENEDGSELKIRDVIKNTTDRITSNIENITIKSDLEESKIENSYIKEEDILKCPSMKNMQPKIGDCIAFKILRITDNYKHKLSDYITGKVIEFDNDNKQIVYEMLSGLDELNELKGKLAVAENNPREYKQASRNLYEFSWLDSIDPRLLYP